MFVPLRNSFSSSQVSDFPMGYGGPGFATYFCQHEPVKRAPVFEANATKPNIRVDTKVNSSFLLR
jgi:hypothetical protein